MLELYQGDCMSMMPALAPVDTIFADPPDNIGLDYGAYDDKKEEKEYQMFLGRLVGACVNLALTSYISFNAKWMPIMGWYAHEIQRANKYLEFRFLVQGFTFGQHNKHDLANNYRPILRLRYPDKAPLYPDAVRVESERMKLGDKRANPKGRVPGDVWRSDFLEYSRVVGNSKQRRSWHPTQLHEGLVEDCLLMSTPPKGKVLDPFAGTGTVFRVCEKLGFDCQAMEIDLNYCEKIVEELGLIPSSLKSGVWERK